MKNSLKKLMAILMIVMLLSANIAGAAETGVLILPDSVKVIEEEAFMGDTSISHVVVPEGATDIGPRAFAGSSVSSLELPSTLETIDDSAFDACGDITVTAPEGSFAYDWAKEKGYIEADSSEVEFTTWYDEEEERLYITGYSGVVDELTVPAEIDGMPVYAIDGEAFGWRPLKKVIISEGIEKIGGDAFYACTELTEVVLPSTMKYISSYAFAECTKLSSINLPAGLEELDSCAFWGCSSLTSIAIPGTVEYIGEETFYSCKNLTDVTIGEGVSEIHGNAFAYTGISGIDLPDSLTYLGGNAFKNCTSLTSIQIPANVEAFEGNPFEGCASLTGITVAEGSAYMKAVDGVLYSADGYVVIVVPAGKTGVFDISDTVTGIGDCAFSGCEALDRVNIPASVNYIGWNAFNNCGADIYVYPNSYAAQWLRENSVPFYYFDSAAGDFTYSVNDDETVTVTGYTGNGGMVVIPATLDGMAVTAIGNNAFNGSQTITSIIIPEGVNTIGDGAFANCANQLQLSFPSSVTSVGEDVISGGAGVAITAIADSFIAQWCDENGLYYTQAGTEDIDYSFNEAGGVVITDYNGSDRVFSIPAAIKGSPVVAIGNSAFDYCDNLTELHIPASLTSIGEYAFSGSNKLRNIYVDAENTVFASADGIVYSADMKSLHICPPGKRGTVTVPAGVTAITDRAFYECENVTEIILPEGLVSIGKRAFNHTTLTSVDIPDTVTSIGDSAFSSCYKLESVDLPASLGAIGDSTFYCCERLTTITIPAAVTYIGYGAFAECYELNEVIFEAGSQLETIDEDAFAWCDIDSIALPESLRTLGNGAFRGNSIESVTIPASVTDYGDGVFGENYNLAEINVAEGSTILKSVDGILYSVDGTALIFCPTGRTGEVVVADGTVSIEYGAFRWCDRIISVTLPDGVESIGEYTFEGCENLMSAYLPASIEYIHEDAFSGCSSLIIYAPEGSYAAAYATEYGFVFEEGVLESKHPYDDHSNETWDYTHPEEAYALRLNFSRKTAFEHEFDYLYIIDEDGIEKEYSGDSLSGASVYLKGNSFSLRLESDESEQRFGFRILSIDAITAEEYAESSAFNTRLIDGGTLEITGYNLEDTDVVIPGTIGGVAVTAIGERAFYGSDITSVVIPEGVTTIDGYAFNSCASLASVTLPSTIRTLGSWSFHGCTALTGITLPEGLTTMEDDVFSGSGLTSITLPDSLTSMRNGCFSRCHNLAEVNLGSGLTWLAEGVFWENYALKSIEIPSCVTEIHENCFIYSGLESIDIPEGVTSIRSNAFYGNNALGSVTLPASLNSIASNAFDNCPNLEITAPIGSYAYDWAYGKNLIREDAVFESEHPVTSQVDQTWYYTAEEDAYALALNFSGYTSFWNNAYIEITDGDGNTTQYYTPQELYNNTVVVMGNSFSLRFVSTDTLSGYFGFRLISVDAIADENAYDTYGGFVTRTLADGTLEIAGYSGLHSEIELPAEIDGVAVTSIGDYAFSYNKRLTRVTIPDSVNNIGYGAFMSCTSLESIDIPDGVTEIKLNTFAWCFALADVDLPASLNVIGDMAFYNCVGLTEIDLPDSLTAIGREAFSACYNLESITIPGSVETVGEYAFSNITWLVEATVCEGVKTLENGVFADCGTLVRVYLPASLESIGDYLFNYSNSAEVYAPEGSYAYQWAEANGFLPENVVFESEHPVTSVIDQTWTYTAEGGAYALALNFSSSTNFYNNAYIEITDSDGETTRYNHSGQITKAPVFVIGDSFTLRFVNTNTEYKYFGFRLVSVDVIADEAAYDSYGGFTTETLDDGTLSITGYTGTKSELEIPSEIGGVAVTAIAREAFRENTKLTRVTIPGSVKIIDEYAFYFCHNLNELTIGEGVSSIGYSAFGDCYGLYKATLPASLESIGDYVFSYCHNLEITAPEGSYAYNWAAANNRLAEACVFESIHPCDTQIDQTWTYTAAEGTQAMVLTFSDKTEFWNGAYIAITDGEGNTEEYHNCENLRNRAVMVTGDSFTLRFVSTDTENEYFGFRLLKVDEFASEEDYEGYGSFTTEPLEDGTLSITGYTGFDSEITIPAYIDDVAVTAISYNAFRENGNLTKVTFPETLKTIGNYAFYYCENLDNVVIPEGVTSIGYYAFAEGNIINLTLPSTLSEIGEYAFYYNDMVTLTIPEGITEIGPCAFYFCEQLENLILPASLDTIGKYAFRGCCSLNSVTVPEGLVSIDEYAFGNCDINMISLPASLEFIHNKAFGDSAVEITAPEGSYAYQWAELKGFLPETVVFESEHPCVSGIDQTWEYTAAEGTYAMVLKFSKHTEFWNDAYVRITYGDGDTRTFYNGDDIQGSAIVIMGDSFTIRFVSTDTWSEYFGFRLVSVDELADEAALNNYGGFITRTLDDGTLAITKYTGVRSELEIPAYIDGVAVTVIGSEAFYNCSTLTSVVIPEGITTIEDAAFCYCTYLTSVQLPDTLTNIGDSAFKYCFPLDDLVIPGSVTNISRYAFFNCHGMNTVTVEDGVERIEEYAFSECHELVTVYLPSSVNYISDYAFENCNNMMIVAPEGSYAMQWANENGYVPENVILESTHPYKSNSEDSWEYTYDGDAYALALTFSVKTSFEDNFDFLHVTDAEGNYAKFTGDSLSGKTIAVMGNSFTLSISSDGSVEEFGFRITDVRALTEEEVENMGGYTYNVLEDGTAEITGYTGFKPALTIPAEIDGYAVTRIGEGAFRNASITSVVIPEGVTMINGYAFNSCASLASVTLPSTIRTLGGWSFHGCTALTSITLPEGLTTMEDDVFSGSGLTSVTLPDSLISMRNGCFSRCYDLAEVNLGSGLTWLDEGVFWESESLKSIIIPDCVTEIYDNCFYMSGIEEITIPASVTNFRYGSSFEGCDSLRVLHTTQGSYAEQFFSENRPDVTIDYISAE